MGNSKRASQLKRMLNPADRSLPPSERGKYPEAGGPSEVKAGSVRRKPPYTKVSDLGGRENMSAPTPLKTLCQGIMTPGGGAEEETSAVGKPVWSRGLWGTQTGSLVCSGALRALGERLLSAHSGPGWGWEGEGE